MATIKDVAQLAGVSTATVSRVINQTTWVEPVTRERVEKAMRRRGGLTAGTIPLDGMQRRT